MASVVIQDACVLLNLLATGRFEDIAKGCGYQFAIVSVVSQETMYLQNADTGEREKINLNPVLEAGILHTLTIESETEKLRYIELALNLDDGESQSIAIAQARHFSLAADDRKARSLIQREKMKIELWSTCSLLRHWQAKSSISEDEIKSALAGILKRARYRPTFGHPDFDWWTKHFPIQRK